MRYVTSMERLARQEGVQEGLQEGIREGIIDTLAIRFGEVPTQVVARLDQIEDTDTLRALRRQALTVDLLDMFIPV